MSRRMPPNVAVFLLILLISPSAADEPRQFRAGAATSNITPPIGGAIIGGFHPFPSTHIHDDLHVRCVALDNGRTRVVIAVCDLLGVARGVYDEARRLVHEETGLEPAHLLMSATHTHSATSALGVNRYQEKQELDEYQKFVARRIADGARRALNNLAPAKIAWASGSEPRHVFNRRWFMKPGTMPPNPFGEIDQVKMNPPRGSADLLEPAGPVDPEIMLLSVRSLEGRPIAVVANYSLHYVGGVGNGHVSADYFALFCDRLQQLLGADRQDPPFVAMMANGTSGNINNIDFKSPGKSQPAYARMKEVADDVAQAAHVALQKAEYRDWAPLGGALRELTVGTRRPTPAQLARAQEIAAQPKPEGHRATLEEIYADRTLRMNDYPPTIDIPIQALRIGDVGIAAIPCEVFVEIGLEIKQKSPLQPAFTMSIANGYYGYLPTPEQHRLGGYETWIGTNRMEVNASTKIVDTLLTMLGELKGRK